MRCSSVILHASVAAAAIVNPMAGCCRGVPLRIGWFTTSFPPYQRWNAEARTMTGGTSRMSDFVTGLMGFNVEIVDLGALVDTQSKIVAAFSRDEIDIAWALGPLAWPAGFHVTEPILHVDSRAVIRTRARDDRPPFSIFQPFERNLWLAIVGATLVAAGVLYVLDRLWHEQTPKNGAFLYKAFAMLLGADDFEPYSAGSRWFRVGFLFAALILSATYTANLAAYLTARRYTIVGPTTFDELRESHARIRRRPNARRGAGDGRPRAAGASRWCKTRSGRRTSWRR